MRRVGGVEPLARVEAKRQSNKIRPSVIQKEGKKFKKCERRETDIIS